MADQVFPLEVPEVGKIIRVWLRDGKDRRESMVLSRRSCNGDYRDPGTFQISVCIDNRILPLSLIRGGWKYPRAYVSGEPILEYVLELSVM